MANRQFLKHTNHRAPLVENKFHPSEHPNVENHIESADDYSAGDSTTGDQTDGVSWSYLQTL